MEKLPNEVKNTLGTLQGKGFQAFVVGGCVRDILIKRTPEDWDIATNATPEEIQKLFPQNFYENKFFTVTIQTESSDPTLQDIEITTFRSDAKYGDRRHPEKVEYAKTIEEDLSRRDFTMNAIALTLKGDLIDPFEGQKDLKKKIIRAVGIPEERFQEDALRMMRAVRFSATLGFGLEKDTLKAIQENAALLKEISQERIRDELVKILMAPRAVEGLETLRETGLLQYILPELLEGYGVTQNKHHIYTVWEHNLYSLQYAVKMNWPLDVRLASFLHDIAKPRVKQGEGADSTFYGHEVVGTKVTSQILSRLKFSNKDIEKVATLVRYHMFYYNVDEVSDASVRRLVRNVGVEYVEDLLKLRMADRIGSGVPKAEPYKLRHFRYLLEKVALDPLSPKMLQINGNDLMKLGDIPAGPAIGQVLDVLLSEILEDPAKNTKKYLEPRVKELLLLKKEELEKLSVKARHDREQVETRRDEMTKQKYWVT
ncbi:MAG: HD domain-containing protein [bacterium]|nr:HD domain-containing protein [bacterium]